MDATSLPRPSTTWQTHVEMYFLVNMLFLSLYSVVWKLDGLRDQVI